MNKLPESGKVLRLEQAFLEAKKRYTALDSVSVRLSHRHLKHTSMQAQPVINKNLFNGTLRSYRIDIGFKAKMSDSLWMWDLPHDVLVGWFAHELGHVEDYHNRTVGNLALFGLKYVFSAGFRTETERRADRLAIRAGFADDLIRTKRFILGVADLNPKYKKRLSTYYYSPEDIESMVQEKA